MNSYPPAGAIVRVSFESEVYQAGTDLYVTLPTGPAIYLDDTGDEYIEVITPGGEA